MQTSYYFQINKIGLFSVNYEGTPELAIPDSSKMQRITVKTLADEVIFQSEMPTKPWNYLSVKEAISHIDTSDGANLYLGDEWVGCTEL